MKFVTLREFEEKYGLTQSTLKRYAEELGIKVMKRYNPENQQKMLVIPKNKASALIANIQKIPPLGSGEITVTEAAAFYGVTAGGLTAHLKRKSILMFCRRSTSGQRVKALAREDFERLEIGCKIVSLEDVI